MLSAFSFQEFRSINRKLVVGLVSQTGLVKYNSLRLRKTRNNEEYSATGGIYAPLWNEGTATFRAARKTFRPAAASIARTVDRYRGVSASSPLPFLVSLIFDPFTDPRIAGVLHRETYVISNRHNVH